MRTYVAVILSALAVGALLASPAMAQFYRYHGYPYYRYYNYPYYGYYGYRNYGPGASGPYTPFLPVPRYGPSHDFQSGPRD